MMVSLHKVQEIIDEILEAAEIASRIVQTTR